jgi:Tetracyclin repressor-like, C-terminal domain
MTQYFDPLVERLIAALREALPECPLREIYWGYQFLTGALTITFAETGRIDKLSGGLCKSSDLDSVHERLPPFIAAGFRAICTAVSSTNSDKLANIKSSYPTRNKR